MKIAKEFTHYAYHCKLPLGAFRCDIHILIMMFFIAFILVPQNIREMNSKFQILEELN